MSDAAAPPPEPSDHEQTYDRGRARTLEALLVTLADRIKTLEGEGALLRQAQRRAAPEQTRRERPSCGGRGGRSR